MKKVILILLTIFMACTVIEKRFLFAQNPPSNIRVITYDEDYRMLKEFFRNYGYDINIKVDDGIFYVDLKNIPSGYTNLDHITFFSLGVKTLEDYVRRINFNIFKYRLIMFRSGGFETSMSINSFLEFMSSATLKTKQESIGRVLQYDN